MTLVSDWLSEINEHGFEDALTATKLRSINDTVADICAREPWPFLEKNLSLTFDGTNAYPDNWPSDFGKVLSIFDANGNKILWERRETLRERLGNAINDSGTPRWYYFLATRASFTPKPSAGTALDMDYLCVHPTLVEGSVDSSILIPHHHNRVVPVGALYKLYMLEDDPELAAVFKAEYEDRISKMREDLSRLQYDRPDRILVLADDDLDYPDW